MNEPRFSTVEFSKILKDQNFNNLKELDNNTKTSIKDYYNKIETQKKEKKTLRCEEKLNYYYKKNSNNLTKKQTKEQEIKICRELDQKEKNDKTTLLNQIYNNLIKYYKNKLSVLFKLRKLKDTQIDEIAEYISKIQTIYLQSNCSNRLSIVDLSVKMRNTNKLDKLNDSYIEYIMYKRENYGKVIKYLNKISNNFIESLTSIIENLPECSSNQSSRHSVVNPPYTRFPVYTGNPPYVSYD
jgi:hypothetical protein